MSRFDGINKKWGAAFQNDYSMDAIHKAAQMHGQQAFKDAVMEAMLRGYKMTEEQVNYRHASYGAQNRGLLQPAPEKPKIDPVELRKKQMLELKEKIKHLRAQLKEAVTMYQEYDKEMVGLSNEAKD